MVDLWLVATGLGLLPLLALILLLAKDLIPRHETAVWGLLIGVVAFLGLAHAGAAILEGNAFLKIEASPLISAGVAAGGLFLGLILGWLVLGRGAPAGIPTLGVVAWAGAAYIALHSFTDGLVLGESYAGFAASGFPLTIPAVGGTLLHRFTEGSLIVVPGLLAAWRPPKSLGILFVALLSVPAAYIPVVLLNPATLSAGAVALDQGIAVFASAVEAGFALLLLLVGLLPRIRSATDAGWALWAGGAFTAMLLIHFLVE